MVLVEEPKFISRALEVMPVTASVALLMVSVLDVDPKAAPLEMEIVPPSIVVPPP
jgi:hypothetical protein